MTWLRVLRLGVALVLWSAGGDAGAQNLIVNSEFEEAVEGPQHNWTYPGWTKSLHCEPDRSFNGRLGCSHVMVGRLLPHQAQPVSAGAGGVDPRWPHSASGRGGSVGLAQAPTVPAKGGAVL